MKTIKVPVTLIVPGPTFTPGTFDRFSNAYIGGDYGTVEHPPMTPVAIEANEADRLLERYAFAGRG